MNTLVAFVFQNTNGVYYDLTFDTGTGAGLAVKHGLTYKSVPLESPTVVSVSVDSGSLTAWKGYHSSRRYIAAVYNTGQALNTVLNAAS